MDPPNKNPTTEGCYHLPVFSMLNQRLSLFISTALSPLRYPANIVRSIERILWSHERKKQAYAICFCPHQVQDTTGMFMLLYWIINLRVAITL